MNAITTILAGTVLGLIVLYYAIKNFFITKMTNLMKRKQYDQILVQSERNMTKHFIGTYNCILFRIRALSYMQHENNFKREIMEALEGDAIVPDKKKELMEIYFHYFLLKNDGEFAREILEYIRAFGEPAFTAYNEQAYEVIIDKKSDLIAVMDTEINSKQYSGFALGVLVYLIGLQYLYLNNKEEARTYFYTSISCFHKNAIYTSLAQKQVDDLSNELGLANPKF